MRQQNLENKLKQNLTGFLNGIDIPIFEEIEENFNNRDVTLNYMVEDNNLFSPFISIYVSGIQNSMESFFLSLGNRIYSDIVTKYETTHSVQVNKENLFLALSMLSIHCGNEISSVTFWELAQKEKEYTNNSSPRSLSSSINLLQSRFTTILAPIKSSYDDNKLIKSLQSRFDFINDFQTILNGLDNLHKAHFLSCGIKQVHIQEKLRVHSDLHMIKVFAQELVNSLCVLNESLLKEQGVSGKTIGELMDNISTTYQSIGTHLGKSSDNSGVYSIGKTNFHSKYDKFLNHIENNITEDDKLKADVFYALHQLRNEALHTIDNTREYYNDAVLFEKTIGLLFICVSAIKNIR